MAKKIIVILLMLLAFTSLFDQNSFAQVPIKWEFTAGGSDDDRGRKLLLTDGGVIVIGNTSSSFFGPNANLGERDAVIFKIDQEGGILWQHTYGGSKEDVILDIKETSDQGFIAVGYTESKDGDLSENKGGRDYWIFKIDNQGELQWTKSYGGSLDDKAISVYETENNDFIVAGDSRSNDGDVSGNNGNLNYDVWIIYLDKEGNLIWEKNYGGSSNEYTASIIQLADGGYLLLSGTESEDLDVSNNYSEDGEDIWVVRIDDEGVIIWEKNFGGTGEDSPDHILGIDEHNFLICGRTSSSNFDFNNQGIGGNDGFVMQINSEGDIIWANLMGGSEVEWIKDITHSADDGGYLFAGYSRSSDIDVSDNYGEMDVWLGKLSNNGELVWEQNYGGTNHDRAESIVLDDDGYLFFTGWTVSSDIDIAQSYGSEDFWVVCLESPFSTGTIDYVGPLDFKLFPNPSNNQITIFSDDRETNVQCDLFNASGQLIKTIQLTGQNTLLDVSTLAAGIYSLRFLSEINPEVHKIVIY